MARYADAGDEVVALYLTRGEAGVSGKDHREAAAIRTGEAEAACRVLGARPVFAAQVDGATEVNAARYAEFAALIGTEKPDVVFTQWPVDTHADHRTCAALTLGAWLKLGKSFALYFYEVDLGSDTQCFRPTHYVDVTATEPRKRAACMAHASQGPAGGFYTKDHEPMLRFRGMECGAQAAEAFVHHEQSPAGRLPE
jgi:N-acetylglucosamine malate deacetylase 1